MAGCKLIIAENFPKIDSDLADYVEGVIDTSRLEFESRDDVYEAVGPFLSEAATAEKGDPLDENDILDICGRLFEALQLELKGSSSSSSNNPQSTKLLDAPLSLGDAPDDGPDDQSIWLKLRSDNSVVDQKKLEKADEKIRQKAERKLKNESKPKTSSPPVLEMATASQASNRKVAKAESKGTNKSMDIRIENFDMSFGEKQLLTAADLVMVPERRYGLIGRNGLGKSTLMRLLASRNLEIPSHIRILHVEQEVVGDDTPALQSVLEADEVRESLLKEEKELNAKVETATTTTDASQRLSEIYAELQQIEADKAPARAASILNGLGFTPPMQQKMTKEYSGGWRMRLALARALFSQPDLLLLDEPTNMLDVRAILWLENYLQSWKTTLLVVSHDREFLNSIATDIVHLHSKRLDAYKGNYENFLKTRTERQKCQQKEYEAQKEYRDHIQVFIDRFRYNANRASQVQSKLKLLEKLPPLVPVEKDLEVVLKWPEPEAISPPVLQIDEVSFYYSKDKPIFLDVDLSANMDSKIGIVGENGAGKSTLLKILLGQLEPVKGHRFGHRQLKLGYFSQHHVDQLDMNLNSVEFIQTKCPGMPIENYRSQLGQFGVSGELALQSLFSLSGGQKSRVSFAAMSIEKPNFFILDEPTNHLDMETIEALGKSLIAYKGGVILVSHDERLLKYVCNEIWLCKDKTVKRIEGGFEEYKKMIEEEFQMSGSIAEEGTEH